MTLQPITGSDYFGPVHETTSDDLGKSWSTPRPVAPLGRRPVAEHSGLEAGVCDVVPLHHSPSNTVLALGHVVFYRGPRFSRNDQLPRYPVYAVRDAQGYWGPRRILQWNDPRGSFIYSNNCGQRVVTAEGDVVMAFTFGAQSNGRSVAGVRCGFDGIQLRVLEVGNPLTSRIKRGFLEPSVTWYDDRYWMTIRAEDQRGYVSVSPDGVQYEPPQPWCWDDGEPLTMSTTQQHFVTHLAALYLVYTRRARRNANVIRWRAPLWIARVDPQTRRLVRASERLAIPMSGDGINDPDNVALMGNFHVTDVNREQSWITVGSWRPRRGATGTATLARLHWQSPE